MGFAELLLLAVGLSMDAFAVSICKGLSMKKASLGAGARQGAECILYASRLCRNERYQHCKTCSRKI